MPKKKYHTVATVKEPETPKEKPFSKKAVKSMITVPADPKVLDKVAGVLGIPQKAPAAPLMDKLQEFAKKGELERKVVDNLLAEAKKKKKIEPPDHNGKTIAQIAAEMELKKAPVAPPAPPSAAPAAKPGISIVKGKKKATPAPTTAPAPEPGVTPISKRITPGAKIETWRIARSARVGQPGYFVQGGNYKKGPKGKEFTVGAEEYHKVISTAQDSLKKHMDETLPVAR